jgi:hypothetical protein
MAVRIEGRFCGPPDSGHGGYSAGLVAEAVGGDAAAVSLRAPPPLERDLEVRRGDDGRVSVHDGDLLVAEGEPADLGLEVPAAVTLEQARKADLTGRWTHRHPFPTCFGCGPERSREEAIALIPGPVAGRDVMASVWTPLADMAGEDGTVTKPFLWAALDCPTSFAFVEPGMAPHVLVRLTAQVTGVPVRAGEPHVVMAWSVGREGRKARGAAAVLTAEGELCGVSEGLWLELRDPGALGARGKN